MTEMAKKSVWLITTGLLCLLFTVGLSAQSPKYEALLGIWDVETEDGQYSFTFEFSMEEEKLKGLFTGTSGEAAMQNLTFEEGNLSFSVDLGGMVIDFKATVAEDKLEGGLSLEYGEANIFGTKRK
jgi:hypothetical protein